MNNKVQLIDTHAHIYLEQFDVDRIEMLERAKEKHISGIYMPNIDLNSLLTLKKLAEQSEICFPMLGLHPCSVTAGYKQVLKEMYTYMADEKYVGIGETGIDLYWDKTYYKEQCDSFQTQIDWAKEMSLPVIIHSRESLDQTIGMISSNQNGNLRGIFHCFNGSWEQAQRIMDLGFLMGMGGVITFKNSGMTEVVKKIPLKYLVLETDAPYLTPTPFRGKRNEPAYVKLVAEKLADIKETTIEEIALVTTMNAHKLFSYTPKC